MKKRIVIFGAGINQIALIEAANELGIISIAIDPNPDAPGSNVADYFYNVKANDYEKTKEICQNHNVNGIVTGQTEKPLRLMARLAQDMGYIFHSPEILERSLDKWRMKQCFRSNSIPCAFGMLFNKIDRINKANLGNLSFPLIMKPKDSTSSQGVFKVNNLSEIRENRSETEYFSKNGQIIIEEYMEGPEYSVEAITYKKQTFIIQYTEKFITPPPYRVEMGHLQPAELTHEEKENISVVVKSAIKAIGIDNSATHTEVKITKNGVKIVEIGPRMGGDFISSYLTLHSCGVNMNKASIQVAMGIEPDIKRTLNQFSYIKYFELPISQKVIKIHDWKDLLSSKDVIFSNLAIKEGDIIPPITHSGHRSGFIIIKGRDKKSIIKTSEFFVTKLMDRIILV